MVIPPLIKGGGYPRIGVGRAFFEVYSRQRGGIRGDGRVTAATPAAPGWWDLRPAPAWTRPRRRVRTLVLGGREPGGGHVGEGERRLGFAGTDAATAAGTDAAGAAGKIVDALDLLVVRWAASRSPRGLQLLRLALLLRPRRLGGDGAYAPLRGSRRIVPYSQAHGDGP
ncbi:hypothetical protein Abr02nite_43500 [Paractinoplanes brasiliensis]|nr:hypothetical protein Abr02nite_43500 [Actinoplanes brasiliensis]